ncbi:MAG TPA: PAS domain S-box protein [Mariprofundaceae bacterium]|nr:PAS domain S-box protein [Mariprofundaceae bacterium]
MGEALSGEKAAGKQSNSLFGAVKRWSGLQNSELLLLLLAVSLVWFATLTSTKVVQVGYDRGVKSELSTLLGSTDEALHLWSHEKKTIAESLASDREIIGHTLELLQSPRKQQALLASPAQQKVRNLFNSYLKGGNLRGFFIIDSDNISLASSRDINVGTVNLLAQQPATLEKMWRGEAVISRVQLSDVPMPVQKAVGVGTRDLNMFVGVPIRDTNGKIIALLALRIDPNETLFSLLLQARLGETGEAYIFDRQGLMLSPSRFREDLIALGLIEPDQSNVARVYVRDNRTNRKSGLNRMATSASQGREDVDVSGYPDYRGKMVVGAWKWEEELDLGLAVEQDFDEAYETLFQMIYMIYIAAAVATFAILMLALFFGRGRKQVLETQNRLAAVVEYAADSIIVTNHHGIIESANPAVEKTFGYAVSEVVGKNVSLLMPEPWRGAHDGYISRFMETGEAHVIGIGREIEAKRADGSLFPAELTISRFELEAGTHFAGTLRDLTQRKEAEAELEAEQQFSEQVLNSLASHVAVLDETGEIVFVNEAWRRFSHENGTPDEQDPVGMNYLTASKQATGKNSENAEEVTAHLAAMLEGKENAFSLEYPCHAPDKKRWFQMLANRFESRGKVMIVTSHMDITERRVAEEMLLREKEMVEEANRSLEVTRQALERAEIGELWLKASDAHVIRANDHLANKLGNSQEELAEMGALDFSPEFNMEAYQEAVIQIRTDGWSTFDTVYKKKDGSLFPIEAIVMYRQGENDQDDMLICFILDISERKRIEDKLRMMSLVAAETDNGVVVTDLDQKIKWVNPGFTDITGFTYDEVIGRKPGDFLQGPKTEKESVRLLSDAIRNKERVETDITNYRKDGREYILHIEIMPIRDESGEVTELIALESDVTEQRKAEMEIRQAKEEAEMANIAKSSFLATMSHEIRTPLNGVVGTIDLLNHTQLESNQKEMVRTARESSLTLMGIIDDVLDFSKIEAGRFELDHGPFSLQDVVEGCVDSLQTMALKKHVDLLVFCDPAIPEVVGDSVRLRQIIFNLTGNAIKFSANIKDRMGHVEVSAVLEHLDDDETNICLAVKDNGIGMSQEQQKKLFKPFVQAESSTTRRFGGTGLGLAISRRLIEMMGGQIELKSRLDEGSLFSVMLTMKRVSDQPVVSAKALSGLQVLLLLEEESEAVRIIDTYLRYAGADVVPVTQADAAECFKTLPESSDDTLVVIDSQRNEESNRQAHDMLRELTAGSRELRFLTIGRGRRRYVRQVAEGTMSIDINAMRRDTLINAVASLAGRESPETGDQELDYSHIAELPTMDEARASGRLILVAEDNETNRNVIRMQLAQLGYVAEIAEDGKQALEMWRKGNYAMLLTDCHMPEMDGYNLARAIRSEEEEENHLPVIAITADALKGTAEKCHASGMDDYVTKPMQIPELRSVMDKWLSVTAAEADATGMDEAIDPNVLGALLGSDDPEILTKFYNDFQASSSEIASQVASAFDDRNYKKVSELAHKLKSAAKTVGANALADSCLALEQAGQAGDGEELDLQMSRFNLLYEDVHVWLEQRIKAE